MTDEKITLNIDGEILDKIRIIAHRTMVPMDVMVQFIFNHYISLYQDMYKVKL